MALPFLSDLAQLLAEAFLEPEALLQDRAGALQASAPAAAAPLLGALAAAPRDLEAQAVEYARLFLHGRDHEPVHLFESVQARGHHLAPDILERLKGIYDGADLSLQDGLTVPPDHLGLELACLGYLLAEVHQGDLARRAAHAALAQRLIQDHLAPFVAAVRTHLPLLAPTPAYAAAASLASLLLADSLKALAEF